MSDLDFEPPDANRAVNSSHKSSSDGGGFNFVFYDGNGQPPKDGEHHDEKPHHDVDFGEPVEVNLSAKAQASINGEPALDPQSPAATPLSAETDPDHPHNPHAEHIGGVINITV